MRLQHEEDGDIPCLPLPARKITGAPHDGMAHDVLGPLVLCDPWYWISRRVGPVWKVPEAEPPVFPKPSKGSQRWWSKMLLRGGASFAIESARS